jgi:type VI secretion system protein ImpA
MIKVDDLLSPISSGDPCGADLSYDPALQELDALVGGKPETQFSQAEEPDWKQVHQHCISLFGRTKDLRVTISLTLAELQQEGHPGFASGLRLIRGLLEQYWDTLHPKLDPDFANDPLERINILSSISNPEGTFGDQLQFLRRARRAPLCFSQQLGSFSLHQIQAANAKPVAAPEGDEPKTAKGPDPALIDAAFRDSNPSFLSEIEQSISSAISDLNGINEFLDRTVGVAKSANFDPLKSVLLAARKQVSHYLETPGGGSASEEPGLRNVSNDVMQMEGTLNVIQERRDVLRSLDAICAYYESTEPSSPVLPLLRRAQQLVGKNFTEILQELVPDGIAQVKLS